MISCVGFPLGHQLARHAGKRAPLPILADLVGAHGEAVVIGSGDAHQVGVIGQAARRFPRDNLGGLDNFPGRMAVDVSVPLRMMLVCVAMGEAGGHGLGGEEKRGRADGGGL